jgi:hypothetical protein
MWDLTKHYRQKGIPIKFVNSEEIFVGQVYNFIHSLDQTAAHKATTAKPYLTHFHHHHQQTRHQQKSTSHTSIRLTIPKK